MGQSVALLWKVRKKIDFHWMMDRHEHKDEAESEKGIVIEGHVAQLQVEAEIVYKVAKGPKDHVSSPRIYWAVRFENLCDWFCCHPKCRWKRGVDGGFLKYLQLGLRLYAGHKLVLFSSHFLLNDWHVGVIVHPSVVHLQGQHFWLNEILSPISWMLNCIASEILLVVLSRVIKRRLLELLYISLTPRS